MFLLSDMVYPLVLVLLCVGAGLAVELASGISLPGVLLPSIGAAALIALAQLTTYVPGVAPATPYALAALGVGGFAVGRKRAQAVLRGWRTRRWQLGLPVIAFAAALAPVLIAGRPTFSAYLVLTDSALHILGADYLIRHGQHYAHLDLVNSYGQFINNYYNHGYPTGADAFLGGTAVLTRVPMIWAFQPFNAVVLATATGPAWLLARRMGLAGGWAAAAALAATLPALVYAYELIGSIKEITALPLILTLGALVVVHPRWLRGGARAAIPFALVVAGGVSALGVAFGAWTVGPVLVLAGVFIAERPLTRRAVGRLGALVGSGLGVLVVAAWPSWHHTTQAVQVAQAVASSPNPGNLIAPLHAVQVFGVWLGGNYLVSPTGASLTITNVLIGVTIAAGIGGAVHIMRLRDLPLSAWLALMVVLAVVLTRVGATWADAKTLMLSSAVFVLVAWASVAALHRAGHRWAALALAAALAGGVVVSDLIQYHDTILAPTARYDELASINTRFAGRGPALFTAFDEYALYELRDLDIGGPDFIFPPRGLAGIDVPHGGKIDLTRGHAAALRAYPLIVTPRDPTAIRPPSAYRLLWQGTYYKVWGRRAGAPVPIDRFRLTGARPVACSRVKAIAGIAAPRAATLVSASPADVVRIDLAAARRTSNWKHVAIWYAMASSGGLRVAFRVPSSGRWNVWLQGQFMPSIRVHVDGRVIGSIGGQVGGDPIVPQTTAPLVVRLARGRHTLSITRKGLTLAPGDGGSANLIAAFLTPAGVGEQQQLHFTSPSHWRSLCGRRFVWIEADRLPR